MREVSVFYSFDDREFFDRYKCLKYECDMLDLVKKISDKYSFFDKDMNVFKPPVYSEDIEEWVSWLEYSCEVCEYIHRDKNLEYEEEQFINNEFGCCVLNEDFENKIGWFKYDTRWNKWDKVDE